MERLTIEKTGSILVKDATDGYTSPCLGCESLNGCASKKIQPCAIYRALEKLKCYEDLDEQGKLKKLPCKAGDTVYVIPSETNYRLNIVNGKQKNNRIYEQVVDRIEFFPSGYLLSTCHGMASVLEQFFNKTWFLAKKQAESALKKMEEKVNDRYHTV